MKKRRFPWIRVALIVLSLVAIGVAYYELKFFDMLIGAYRLEKERKPMVKVSRRSLIYMMKSKAPEAVFLEEMERLGWTFYDAYGRGYLFTKGGEEILATKSTQFGRYTVYEIHNEKYFNHLNGES